MELYPPQHPLDLVAIGGVLIALCFPLFFLTSALLKLIPTVRERLLVPSGRRKPGALSAELMNLAKMGLSILLVFLALLSLSVGQYTPAALAVPAAFAIALDVWKRARRQGGTA